MSDRGSISVESTICIFSFLFVVVLMFANIYSYTFIGDGFEKSALYILENNYCYVSDKKINELLDNRYIVKNKKHYKSFNIKEKIPDYIYYKDTSNQTIYVTITGKKYHKLSCKYARLSSKLIDVEDAKNKFNPCSVCIN